MLIPDLEFFKPIVNIIASIVVELGLLTTREIILFFFQ